MDIRRLVNRISDALGPDADPTHVEAVAAAVLDECDEAPGKQPHRLSPKETGERVLVTAYGVDRPGILAAVTNVVSDAGCNILDVSQKILQGYFTLIMLADISSMHGSVPDLQQQLSDTGNRLGVRVMVQHEDLFESMHRP
ncbi:MAG: ACT domain-containing protein [Rhodothermales bacterium]